MAIPNRKWKATLNIKDLFENVDNNDFHQVMTVVSQTSERIEAFINKNPSFDTVDLSLINEWLKDLRDNTIDDMSAYQLVDEYDHITHELYDWADSNKVWVG